MNKNHLCKRYFIFIIGLFINSLGVAVITKAALGTSPISSIPYVLSLYFPLTLGQFTILFSLFLIFFQILILGKKFEKVSLLQIPVSVAFGYFIDFSMFLLGWLSPENYFFRFLALFVGCLILGFGVYTEVIADVVMLPGEAFVKAVTKRFHTEFGITKVCFDAGMTVFAAALSLLLFVRLNGVGAGTVIAALIVGIIARYFGRVLKPLTRRLLSTPEEPESIGTAGKAAGENPASGHPVITIGREFGCGGWEIGKLVAEKLNLAYYDSNLLDLLAKETGKNEEYLKKTDQKLTNSFLFDLYLQCNAYTNDEKDGVEFVYEAEKKVIQEVAGKEGCVIVGRLANFILSKDENAFHVFLHSAMEDKIEKVMARESLPYKEASQQIQKVDRQRREHCRLVTGKEWGHSKYYDLCINTAGRSAEKVADGILWFLKNK